MPILMLTPSGPLMEGSHEEGLQIRSVHMGGGRWSQRYCSPELFIIIQWHTPSKQNHLRKLWSRGVLWEVVVAGESLAGWREWSGGMHLALRPIVPYPWFRGKLIVQQKQTWQPAGLLTKVASIMNAQAISASLITKMSLIFHCKSSQVLKAGTLTQAHKNVRTFNSLAPKLTLFSSAFPVCVSFQPSNMQ